MFLASWCPACQAELPEVVTWLEQGNLPADVELTAIATGLDAGRPNWPPDAWFEAEGYDGRVLVDDADGQVADGLRPQRARRTGSPSTVTGRSPPASRG
jgi:thiol-disulfide isomerase/thioredoxin